MNMFAVLNELLTHRQIPAMEPALMSALLHYVFNLNEFSLRIQIAETVYRYDHDHPHGFDIFLACTLPLAQRAAERKASRLFLSPSDWQIELMYDGAVTAMIMVFQRNSTLRPGPDAFRRYIVRALALGTVRSYFMRQENDSVRPVGQSAILSTGKKPFRNKTEREIIARELLDKVTTFPDLPAPVAATLHCIGALGPDSALKEHAYTASGDPDKWKRDRGRRPILDPAVIARTMGISRREVHRYLCQARVALRAAFNPDGRLFLTR